MSIPTPNARSHTAARFEATEWTVVLGAAADTGDTALAAMERLCRIYWPAVYAFIRRQGHAPHDAQDLAQDFFARLIEKQSLQHVDRDKGRFRSFLIASLRNFLANDRDHAQAAKRGAEWCVKSLEQCWALKERTYAAEEKPQARQVYRKLLAESAVD